jgi:hypothetical protein
MGPLKKVGTDDYCDREGCLTKTKCSFPLNYIFFPGKRAFPVKSCAKMQPMLQISIAGVY